MNNPYPEWKRRRCQWCAQGISKSSKLHWVNSVGELRDCTAPTPEQYIAELEAENAELRAKAQMMRAVLDEVEHHLYEKQDISRCREMARAARIQAAMPDVTEVKS